MCDLCVLWGCLCVLCVCLWEGVCFVWLFVGLLCLSVRVVVCVCGLCVSERFVCAGCVCVWWGCLDEYDDVY